MAFDAILAEVAVLIGGEDAGHGQRRAQVGLGSPVTRSILGAQVRWDGDGDQDGNDENDHHQFDQREATVVWLRAFVTAGMRVPGVQ